MGDKVKAGTEAAKEIVPLANQYPLAIALVIMAAFTGVILFFLLRYILKQQGDRLLTSIENDAKIAALLDAQSETLKAITKELHEMAVQVGRVAVALAKLSGKTGIDLSIDGVEPMAHKKAPKGG